jgi:hypothetical protein
MFQSDLLYLFHHWKVAGDKILLLGNFNENKCTCSLATALAGDKFKMSEMCNQITGTMLLPTHICGHTPIDAVFSNAGLLGSAAALLPSRVRVGNHSMFVVDVESGSMLGNISPRVILAARHLLTCASDHIKHRYIWVLNLLLNRHLIFKKLLRIDKKCDCISLAQVQLCLNKIDLELEQFMKTAERDSHKFKRTHIEWSPRLGVWIHRWCLARVKNFLARWTRDLCNLICACRLCSVMDPRHILMDELKTEFFVLKRNLDLLTKNGPAFHLKFLKGLFTAAKGRGN